LDMGITPAFPPACLSDGVDVPVIAVTGFGLALASANPFRDQAQLRVSLAQRTRVTIAIYNVLGERVRDLVDETIDAGVHRIDWDGKSDEGSRSPSGIYFVRMRAAGHEETKKLALLR